ncbi:MAG: 3-phosphoserine/phosphohydroxythreonine transaminase [Planctomycetota bacterium]|jgi:phosphoserine aminotransferase
MTTTTATTEDEIKALGKRIYNFSAGPAVLPEEVLLQARRDLWDIDGSGVGILEHSHRGKVFTRVIEQAEADCRQVGGISDDYHVLFLQGGATLQFAMVPMSFLAADGTADYVDTGSWTSKAIKEAKPFGKVGIAFDGSKTGYDHIPATDELSLTAGAVYSYYCSNNTICGTEFSDPPATGSPLVCDASSDIFSRPLDVSRHALIFAGAQKNLGPAGCTLVIVRKDFLERAATGLPSMLDYRKHADKGSCLNTPPAFAIYVMGQVFKWIQGQGGLEAVGARNEEKARIVYDAIDGSGGFFRPVARPGSRSWMNITFRTPGDELDKQFIEEAGAHDMSGLKGHRSVGGLRASIYNAFPRQGCEVLASFMKDFAARNG